MKSIITFKNLVAVLILTSFFLINQTIHATNYTTLTTGNWSNSTNVWSMDGVTPCSCSPAIQFTNDSIFINHEITLDNNIEVDAGSYLHVRASGKLTLEPSTFFNLVAQNGGNVFSEGLMSVSKLTVHVGSMFTAKDCLINVEDPALVYGEMMINAAILDVYSGNFNIFPGGELTLLSGAKVRAGGNINNDNLVHICPTCCVESTGGNVNNSNTGTITGSGALRASGGNLKNQNAVDLTLSWCVSGNSTGMPMAANCTGSTNICNASPLAFSKNTLKAQNENNQKVDLLWQFEKDESDFSFELQKSQDGDVWNTIQKNNIKNANTRFTFHDNNLSKGRIYYRIKYTDRNNLVSYSNVSTVMIGQDKQYMLYPNPIKNSDVLNIDTEDKSEAVIQVYNQVGQLVHSENKELQKGHNTVNINTLSPSIYTVVIKTESDIYSQKLMVSMQ